MLCVGCVAGPDFLAIDPEAVAGILRARPEVRQIRTCIRFRPPLAPDHFSCCHRLYVLLLLLIGAKHHDGRPDVVEIHVLRPTGFSTTPHLLPHHILMPDVRIAAAILLRPGHGQPAFGGKFAAELQRKGHDAIVVGKEICPP